MKTYSFIVQGSGKGHVSQALALGKLMNEHGIAVNRIYLGRNLFSKSPGYFQSAFDRPVTTYYSPDFVRTSDRKGIRISFSIFVNMLVMPVYLFEMIRIGWLLRTDRSNHVVNFYDPLGGLAARLFKGRDRCTVISHHFYLSHPAFIHPFGYGGANFWLQLLNQVLMRSAGRVLALSFRRAPQHNRIIVLPPLIDPAVLQTVREPGERDLCYFLNPGFVPEMLDYYRRHPGSVADIFTDPDPGWRIPANVEIHAPSRTHFLEKMKTCRRIICTAGFDTVSEAFYLGVPVLVIPSVNHYEQTCNAIDAARTGMAFQLDTLQDLEDLVFEPAENRKYREWVDMKRLIRVFM